MVNGWPSTPGYDRTVVLVRAEELLAPIFKATRQSGTAILPRGLVESRLNCLLSSEKAGVLLARHGLAVVGCADHTVELAGVPPLLAAIVNDVRHHLWPRPRLATIAVQAALDLPERPRRLSDATRLRTAEIFEELRVDASALLLGDPRVRLISTWTFGAPHPASADRQEL